MYIYSAMLFDIIQTQNQSISSKINLNCLIRVRETIKWGLCPICHNGSYEPARTYKSAQFGSVFYGVIFVNENNLCMSLLHPLLFKTLNLLMKQTNKQNSSIFNITKLG